jgi:hypothetical protein
MFSVVRSWQPQITKGLLQTIAIAFSVSICGSSFASTQNEPLRATQNSVVWGHSRPIITGDYLNLGKSPQQEESQVPIPVPLPTPLLIGGLGLVGAILVRRRIQGR